MGDPKVCRACLTTKESFQYSLIDNISADAYYFCTSVQIKDSEELPRTLCTPCFEQLALYSKFKQTCIDSQNTLLGYKQVGAPVLNDNQPTPSVSDLDVKNEHNESDSAIVKYEAISDSDQSNGFEAASSSQESQEECCPTKEPKRVRILSRAKKISRKRLHTYKALKTTRVNCDRCNMTFRKQSTLDAHKLTHDGQTHYPCHTCSKTFATQYGLSRHTDTVHTLTPLSAVTCDVCGRVCASRYALREHVRTHKQLVAVFICDLCGRTLTSKSNLKVHMQTHNKERERTHKCKHCTKQFYSRRAMEKHLLIHKERHFICCQCNNSFKSKYSLKMHIQSIHDQIKPYKCDIPCCDKRFATKESLMVHNRSHSGEKPYLCLYCSKGFASRRRLVDHHRIHTGEKPHHCTVCPQRFTQRGSLQRHMKVHNKSCVTKQT